MKLEEMTRTELTDLFITRISANEKKAEIAYMLALFTAMQLSHDSAVKYDVSELLTDELADLIETGILNQNGAGFDEEEKAWGMVLDTLKPEKILDIVENIDRYMIRYHSIVKPLEQLEHTMLKIFVESEVGAK